MTSSVTHPGKAFARIAMALAIAAMGIYVAGLQPRRAGPSSDSCSCWPRSSSA